MSKNKSESQFEIAHNLNNLLGIILSRVQLVQRKNPEIKFRSDLAMIERAAQEASGMAQSLQSTKALNITPKKEWLYLNDLLSDIVEMTRSVWQYQSQKRGISIHVALQFRNIPKIYGVPSLLKDVFINFILNAVDALSLRGGMIEIQTVQEDGFVKVKISDSGIGMSKETLEKLYEPYFSTKGKEGSGLGLTSARKIIESHGGEITVQSQLHEGTTFTLAFPMEKKIELTVPRNDQSLRVMLVDDEKDYRLSTAELLTLEGYCVEQASDAKEALQKLQTQKFDVILSDVNMPGMSGKELATFIKEKELNTKVILISGKHKQFQPQGDEQNIDGWLTKPCLVEDIKRMIQQTCH